MSEQNKEKPNLEELILPDTDFEKFVELVGQFITDDDMRLLGTREESALKVAESIAYLGVFAPAPATFNEGAFFSVATFGLSEDAAKQVLSINKRLGVIKDESVERMSVSEKWVETAKNQFLSEE